jgi:hypothetical protein
MREWKYISTHSDLHTKTDVVSLKHQLLYSRESNPVTNSAEGLVGPQIQSGYFGEQENPCPCQELHLKSLAVQLIV